MDGSNIIGMAIALLALMSLSFGVFWRIIQDVKKSAHARIDRMEGDFRTMEAGCIARLSTYVNKDDVNKIDNRIENLANDMRVGFATVTSRIDSLIMGKKSRG